MPLPTRSPPCRAAEAALAGGRGAAGRGGGRRLFCPLTPRALQPPAPSLLRLVCKHPNNSGGLVSRRSLRCAGRRWEFPSSGAELPAQSSPMCGTSPKTILGVCSPRRIHRGSHPLCCQLHPKTERFGVWLASVPGLAVTPLLTRPSMPVGGSWRGAMVPPGGGLRLCGAVDGHSNHKSTWGDSVQLDAALSSDPFLTLFDVPFLLSPGAVYLSTVLRRWQVKLGPKSGFWRK